MSYKIGVFGSSVSEEDQIDVKAIQLGKFLGLKQCAVITGACSGLPYIAAKSDKEHGADIYGYSPIKNLEEQVEFTPHDDLTIYKKITYIPEHFSFKNDVLVCKKYRNVISTANCDAGIIISGRWGTLNEFTNLFDMGKIIGVLKDTAGIANELPDLTAKISKQSAAKIIFDSDPQSLIDQVIASIEQRS